MLTLNNACDSVVNRAYKIRPLGRMEEKCRLDFIRSNVPLPLGRVPFTFTCSFHLFHVLRNT